MPRPILRTARLAGFAAAAAALSGCATSLIQAAAKGQTVRVAELIEQGVPVNVRGYRSALSGPKDSTTALLEAAKGGHRETIRELLRRGADPDARDEFLKTPLLFAAARGHAEAVAELLAAGSEVDARDRAGMTPLLWAAESDYPSILLRLLAAGARVDAEDDKGLTALMRAASHGHANAARVLLDAGASLEPQDNLRRTALDHAKRKRRDEIKELLQNAAAERLDAPASGPAQAHEPAPSPAPTARVDVPAYRNAEDADRFALVVGIERYASLPDAAFAQSDARAMQAHLRAMGFPKRNLIHLEGNQATLTGIRKYVQEWLPRNTRPSSRVFLYFSGHGAPDPETGQAYLVPWDGDPQFLKTTAYPLKELYASLSALGAGEVVVALDSCFSGAGGRSVLPRGMRPLVTKVSAMPESQSDLIVLSAASTEQITGTLPARGHGLFTYYLLEGLNGGAVDGSGRVTVRGLYEFIVPRVQDAARRQNREQSPVLAGSARELVLAVH